MAGPQGRLVAVPGEAGAGKSRLIGEFARGIAGQAAVLRGRCLSYGAGITFFPLAGVLRRAAGIVPEDGEQDARLKLRSCVGGQLAGATGRVESVLGLAAPVRQGRAGLGRAGGPSGAGPPQAAGGGLG